MKDASGMYFMYHLSATQLHYDEMFMLESRVLQVNLSTDFVFQDCCNQMQQASGAAA